jgi:hypothetical protein
MNMLKNGRVIVGLEWAKACPKPAVIPISRPRGKKAWGKRYEKALARELPSCAHGQWWEYQDKTGHGWCQTDLITSLWGELIILECKYTWVAKGHAQLEGLYCPVVQMATGKAVTGIVVCKILVPEVTNFARVTDDFAEAIWTAKSGHRSVLHWTGIKPLFSHKIDGFGAPYIYARTGEGRIGHG